MITLLDEQWAPITSSIGFLELPLGKVAEGLVAWRDTLYPHADPVCLDGPLVDLLPRLEPLTAGGCPRELVVQAGGWTAYFDNGFRGTDPVGVVSHLSEELTCRGLTATSVPHTIGLPGVSAGRAGQVLFELFVPWETDFLNFARTIGVTWDRNKWVFNSYGPELSFEEPATYRARRVRDRFTSDMLERYCRAVGVDVFNAHAYGSQAVLVESAVPLPSESQAVTVAEAQRLLDIEPGVAKELPG